MNEDIRNIITDFLINEDNCKLFKDIAPYEDYDKVKLLREYSTRLAAHCKYGKDYD